MPSRLEEITPKNSCIYPKGLCAGFLMKEDSLCKFQTRQLNKKNLLKQTIFTRSLFPIPSFYVKIMNFCETGQIFTSLSYPLCDA